MRVLFFNSIIVDGITTLYVNKDVKNIFINYISKNKLYYQKSIEKDYKDINNIVKLH